MSATPLPGSPCPRFLIVPKGLQSGNCLCSGLLSQQRQLCRPSYSRRNLGLILNSSRSLSSRLSLQQVLGPTWNMYPASASCDLHLYHSCPGFLQRPVSQLLPYRFSVTLSPAIRMILWKNEPDSVTSVFRILRGFGLTAQNQGAKHSPCPHEALPLSALRLLRVCPAPFSSTLSTLAPLSAPQAPVGPHCQEYSSQMPFLAALGLLPCSGFSRCSVWA